MYWENTKQKLLFAPLPAPAGRNRRAGGGPAGCANLDITAAQVAGSVHKLRTILAGGQARLIFVVGRSLLLRKPRAVAANAFQIIAFSELLEQTAAAHAPSGAGLTLHRGHASSIAATQHGGSVSWTPPF